MTAPTLRIATCNVLHGLSLAKGSPDLTVVAAAIAALEADVAAVQEIDRCLRRTGEVDQVAELAGDLGWHGAFAPALIGDPDTAWEAAADDDGRPGYGVGLLSRWPLADVRRTVLPGGGPGARRPGASPQRPGWDREPRVALSARVDVGGRPVDVTTTHLSYLPWRAARQLRATGRAAESAMQEAPWAGSVLLGDLNLPVWGVRTVLPRWRHAGGAPTYPAGEPRLQVDHILVRGPLEIRSVDLRRGTSDHLWLVAELARHT